jgi:transcriptional regulator with XRE-family HTH domain
MEDPMDGLQRTLAGIEDRLTGRRRDRGTTSVALARSTGISTSTLSRLEAGKRRATLELLLPIAHQPRGLRDIAGQRPDSAKREHCSCTFRDP